MKKSTLVIVLLAIVSVAVGFGLYSYNKGPRDLSAEKADVSMSANALLTAFQSDETAANGLYLDKVVVVTGTISAIEKAEVSTITLETGDLMSAIVCELAHPSDIDGRTEGEEVKIKGQCTGFLSDVILVKCIIEN